MTYYKLLTEDKFIGVATSENFLRYQKKHDILLYTNEEHGQYVQCNWKLYRDKWMIPVESDSFEYEEAKVIAISKDEYDSLYEAIENDEEISATTEEVAEEPVAVEILVEEEVTEEFVKEAKIKEMSLACGKAITGGFDLDLDGEQHHFSLATQDQMNLLSIQTQILSGQTEFVYHADGEAYKTYNLEEMTRIIDGANTHKMFHLAYFSSLKAWINSLSRISNITAVQYGDDIPKKYQSTILKKFA